MPQEFSSSPKSRLLKLQKQLKPLRVSVICGGSSSERKISLRSGKAVAKALRNSGLKVSLADPSSKLFHKKLKATDIAFLTLHGKGGEDGVIQPILEKWGIPYIGSDSRHSRVAFDKVSSKEVFRRHGIPTAPYGLLRAGSWKKSIKVLNLPLFMKPPKEGSSIGAFPVEDLTENAVKITQAIARFGTLMAEQKIDGREFTVGILGNTPLPVIELRPKSRFYDYRSKYTKGMTEYLIPAPIEPSLEKKLRKIAVKAHRALGLRDLSRIDMMVDQAGQVFVLEANSLPGFTELSLLPKAARAVGISFEELCCKLLYAAWKRKAFRRKHG